MPRELIYTSATSGLLPGTRGFGTVACTAGMSPPLVAALESLSGYRRVLGSGTEHLVVYSHLLVTAGGNREHVISRIGDAGLDYSGRANMIAHHLVFGPEEQGRCDPSFLMNREENFVCHWDRAPYHIPQPAPIPTSSLRPEKCLTWERHTGDAGWGGVLAATVENRQGVYLVYRPDQDILPLILESLGLLVSRLRWNATFSTFYTKMPPGTVCQWKGVLAGTPEAAMGRNNPNVLLLDLTAPFPHLGNEYSASAEYIQAARTGVEVKRTLERSPLVVKMVPHSEAVEAIRALHQENTQPVLKNGGGQPGLTPEALTKINQLDHLYAQLGNEKTKKKQGRLITFLVFLVLILGGSILGVLFQEELKQMFSNLSSVEQQVAPEKQDETNNLPTIPRDSKE